jgi:SAM-dependent methyltransferase
MLSNNPDKSDLNQIERFLSLLRHCLDSNTFVKVVLGKYRGPERELTRVSVRQLMVRDQPCLSFVYRYKTKDVTGNVTIADGIVTIRELLANSFNHAHLLTVTQDIQLSINRNGKCVLRSGKSTPMDAPSREHDREKQRFLDLSKPFLVDLGITNEHHQLVPSMSRKWKQINKFVEVLDHALESTGLKHANHVSVVDFGSGKGYLTFAIHDYLRNSLGIKAQVTGIELREDLVRLCNNAVKKLQLDGLLFEQGDIRSYAPGAMNIMIALHACDTATDYAIHKGIRSGASIIMCSPCCHKQIRPQMQSPRLLRPILRHGIHFDQESEMVTDSLRALLLEAKGYATRVFEFVSLEHTSKNKMILAVKHSQSSGRKDALAQVREIKNFYGIRDHCLETLLTTHGL